MKQKFPVCTRVSTVFRFNVPEQFRDIFFLAVCMNDSCAGMSAADTLPESLALPFRSTYFHVIRE